MGRVFQSFLSADRIYTCCTCRAHLAQHEDLISKAFMGRNGRAYLFKDVSNIMLGNKEDRMLITGLHTVADLRCNICQTMIGWKYIYAYDDSQKYKEGTFIVEKSKIVKQTGW